MRVSAASGVSNFLMERTFLRMMREEETVLRDMKVEGKSVVEMSS